MSISLVRYYQQETRWQKVEATAGLETRIEMPDRPIRYVRFMHCPVMLTAIEGYDRGKRCDPGAWCVNTLLNHQPRTGFDAAWAASFTLPERARGSFLCVAVNGRHGIEKAYAALRVGETHRGAPKRTVSFPSNTWECAVRPHDSHYTYLFPVTDNMVGAPIDAVVLGIHGCGRALRPEACKGPFYADLTV